MITGNVVNCNIIRGHIDGGARQLAGQKVAIYPETIEDLYNMDGSYFGRRVKVIPINLPGPEQTSIMTRFVKVNNIRIKHMLGHLSPSTVRILKKAGLL